jgi:hypothetical protein
LVCIWLVTLHASAPRCSLILARRTARLSSTCELQDNDADYRRGVTMTQRAYRDATSDLNFE